jgi:hypothetical protein
MYCVPEMRMSNVQAKLASALLLSVAANVGLTAVMVGAARAADGCITEPGADTPQGKHWYFRIERGSGRHCWYLRGEDEGSARTPVAEAVAPAKPPSRTTGNAPPTRSLADARAEYAPRARAEDNGDAAPAPSVFPDPRLPPATTGIGPGAGTNAPAESPLASRWPQASDTPSTANPPPTASLMVADAQSTEAETTTPVAAEPPQPYSPPVREVASLQKLLIVVFGALALAGLTGSLVYRLAGVRSRRQRQERRWPQRQATAPSLEDETQEGAPWVAPELSPAVLHEDVADMDVADLDVADHSYVAHDDAARGRVEFGRNDDSFEKIEDFLARLTRQLQDELQTTRATELENPRPQ